MRSWYCVPAAALACVAGLAHTVKADPANVGKVIITEIFANPNDNDNYAGANTAINSAGDNLEYIEIFNTTNAPIDISGWFLDDEDPTSGVPFPAGTIIGARQALVIIGARLGQLPNDAANPGQYLPNFAVWTPALFQAAFPTANLANVLIIPGNITIANTPTVFNEIPFIVDADGTVVDIANYENNVGGWPAVTAGVSIQLRPQFLNSVDNDRGCAWRLASADALSVTSLTVNAEFDPDGAGPAALTLRDQLTDSSNVCSPGVVNETIPADSDCNSNGISDLIETCSASASSPDCNANLIPDACEADLNGNGVPDSCDVLVNRESLDRNLNNVLDFTDINLAGGVNGVGGMLDTNANGIIDGGEGLGRVIITEILIDPFTAIAGASLEWVEIQNISSSTVDISGYRLVDIETGGDGFTTGVPAGTTLAAGEVAVLVQLPASLFSQGGPSYTAAQAVTLYQRLWQRVGQPTIRFIPLSRWGARATNATATAEVLALVSGAVVNDAIVPAAQGSTSGPHPTRLVGPGAIGTWVINRGFIVDVANFSNANSNSEPLNGWPGSDSHSSFILNGQNRTFAENNSGPNWILAIEGLNGTFRSADLTGQPDTFGLTNLGEDFGSPGFVPSGAFQSPTGEVIISEINATTNSSYPGSNPIGSAAPNPIVTTVAGRDEFIEIANTTNQAIDISGWYLQDEDGRTQGFPAGTILLPNTAAVIVGADRTGPGAVTGQPPLSGLDGRNITAEFYNSWGCGYQVIEVADWYTTNRYFGIDRLADGPSFINEITRLVKADGTVVDITNYDDDGTPTAIAIPPSGWPADASGAIATFWSIYVLPGSYDQASNDSGLVWAASLTGFEGGRLNFADTVLNLAVGFRNGIYNGSQFGSPGFVDGLTTGTTIIPRGGFNCANCFVDFNNDGFLNQEDLAGFITTFLDESVPAGPSGTSTTPCPEQVAPYNTNGLAGDYNRDCVFNQEDLAGFVTEYLSQTENPVGCIPG